MLTSADMPLPNQNKILFRIVAALTLVMNITLYLGLPANSHAQVGYVPTAEVPILPVGAATISLSLKDLADVAATSVLKIAIRLTQDMVVRWIVEGNFKKPVFSKSFSLDLKKSAENAARTIIGKITNINFCDGDRVPPGAFLDLSLRFALQCRFNGDFVAFQQGRVADFISLSSSEQSANEYWNHLIIGLDRKLQEEARAKKSFIEEYRAGQGFLGIRGEDGQIKTPGSYVRNLIVENKIVSSQRQVDVANTLQQAIDTIITTAVRTSINKGLDAVFSESGNEGVGGEITPPPAKEPILQKIAATIARGITFLANVEPTADVENVRGITPRQAARIREITTSLANLQTRLIAATDRDIIERLSADVDSRDVQLTALMRATRYCSEFAPRSAFCPSTP